MIMIDCEYATLSDKMTRTKKLVIEVCGKINDNIIDEIAQQLFITRQSAIDILEEGKDGFHTVNEYKELALYLNTSIDYLIGITDTKEPYKYNSTVY